MVVKLVYNHRNLSVQSGGVERSFGEAEVKLCIGQSVSLTITPNDGPLDSL